MPKQNDIYLKKQYGQHFLREEWVVQEALAAVQLDETTSVFEIGGGAGFLTGALLATPLARLVVFEIDPDWAGHLRNEFAGELARGRLTVVEGNFLDLDLHFLEEQAPWTLLANLPYNVTFPILKRLWQQRQLLKEGVIMIQEEVAQKLLKRSGRAYGPASLFYQHYFAWQLLAKVPPTAFYPPPKVMSRLLYFKPKREVVAIADEHNFWRFIRACFRQPRRTLRNNLQQAHYTLSVVPEEMLAKRAQQLTMKDFLMLWEKVR